MTIRTIVRGIAVLVCVAFALTARAEEKTLRVATEGAYPPFNFVDASGQLAGFDVEIARALCAAMKENCSFTAVAWADIIDGLVANRYDMIVASMAFSQERAARIAFSDPYYRSHSTFIGDPAKLSSIDAEALKGKRIAAGEGTIQAEYLQKFYPGSTLVLAPNQPAATDLLVKGKVDVVLADAIDLLTFMQTQQGSKFDYIGDPVTGDFLQSTSHITARKDDTALIEKVNAALKQIRLDGTYDRINAAYFPFSIY